MRGVELELHTLPEHLTWFPYIFTRISVVCVVHFVKIHVFTYLVPYCDVCCNFHVQTIFGSSLLPLIWNRIGGVMASVSSSSAVYRGFEFRSGQTKDYTIGMHAALRRKSKTWLALGIRIMFQSGATCLTVDCCFSE